MFWSFVLDAGVPACLIHLVGYFVASHLLTGLYWSLWTGPFVLDWGYLIVLCCQSCNIAVFQFSISSVFAYMISKQTIFLTYRHGKFMAMFESWSGDRGLGRERDCSYLFHVVLPNLASVYMQLVYVMAFPATALLGLEMV